MPRRLKGFFGRQGRRRTFVIPLAVLVFTVAALALGATTAQAQTTIDWDDIECGGDGWAGPGVGPAGPATQQFTDVGCLGINMSIGYSGNMWDNSSTPNLYNGSDAPVAPLSGTFRWTNNPNDTGAGAVGSATGPSTVSIIFEQPVYLNQFTVASLSRLYNAPGDDAPFRYEWMDVRVFDKDNNLLRATSVTPSTYAPDGSTVVRADSPVVQDSGTGIYNLRGTSIQDTCTDECGYDRLTFGFTTTPVQRIELIHFVTDGPTVTDDRSPGLTSVAVERLVISAADDGLDWGDAPDTYGTLDAGNGPSHRIISTLYLGAQVDEEVDGRPTNTANGDDTNGLDDEDGVVTATLALTEGGTAVVRVTATNQTASPAFLYGWIDFDGNGVFDDDESANTTIAAGAVQQQVELDFGSVPDGAPAATYARFRLSTDDAGTEPTGAAADGEVEDYPVSITPPDQLDWGDAPDTSSGAGPGDYNTLGSNNGPSHSVVANLSIGDLIDAENDGQPTANANGDDTTNADDEDGVTIPTLVENQDGIITVNVTNLTGEAAVLYCWIDFNANGVFETSERVSANVPTGANDVDVTLNFGAVPALGVNQTFARCRLSSDPAAAEPLGPAQGGEVEDHVVTISTGPSQTLDWGDAPDTGDGTGAGNYNTLAADDGPHHGIVTGLRIGPNIDAEANGQPTANADGDDTNPPTAPDDEDGVNPFDLALTEGDDAVIRVSVTNQLESNAMLYGWIDFNGNGAFEVSERAAITVPAGSLNTVVNLDFGTVPANGVTATFGRFRLSTDTAAGSPTGAADDGEVEDYPVTIGAVIDWGDAPDASAGTGTDNYNTLASDNGPSHRVINGLNIGALVDGEADGQPTLNANGDDTNPVGAADDEDGVLVSDLTLTESEAAEITVVVNNSTQESAVLYGWIDFNANGVFDATESAQVTVPAGTVLTPVTLDFGAVPVTGVTQTYARFRISTDTAAALPTGPAPDGEVEDYPVTISLQPAAIDLVSFTAELVDANAVIRWTTGAEVDTNGFHLYRATTSERKDAVRITEAMIPAQGPNGGVYTYVDTAVLSGPSYSYWLIEVENGVEAAEYGPVLLVTRTVAERSNNIFLPMIVGR